MQKLNFNIKKLHKAPGSQSSDSMSSDKINKAQQKKVSIPSSFES